MDTVFLLLCNIVMISFWAWVCFFGGDKKWSAQVQGFWHAEEYKWLTPKVAKVWVTVGVVAALIGSVAVIVNKMGQ